MAVTGGTYDSAYMPPGSEWESADGLNRAAVRVTEPDGNWPAGVRVEWYSESEWLLAEDVDEFVVTLWAASRHAHRLNLRAATASNTDSEPKA